MCVGRKMKEWKKGSEKERGDQLMMLRTQRKCRGGRGKKIRSLSQKQRKRYYFYVIL